MQRLLLLWLHSILPLLILLIAVDSEAALYCVVDFSGKRCQYTNLEVCQKAAGKQGSCFLNREEMLTPTGGAPYCLVESWRTECVYRDFVSCKQIAKPRRATCIANPNLTIAPVVNADNPIENEGYLPSPTYQPNPGQR